MSSARPPRLGIVGSSGRLGRVLRDLAEAQGWQVSLAASSRHWEETRTPHVLLDVSHRSACARVADYCGANAVALVEATSGLQDRDLRRLGALAEAVPVLRATNLSLGHYLQARLLQRLAELLGARAAGADATVVDRHTAAKADRPSATALGLAHLWREHSGREVADVASIRGGLPVADHTFQVAFAGEELQLVHRVADRGAAARGALTAARWIAAKGPGLWDMNDVYGALK